MYEIKLVGLLINNNLLAGHSWISPTVFEIKGFEKWQITPPPLILGKYCPDCAVQGRLDSQLRQIFYLRIFFHRGSHKDKFRKMVSWFSLRQDVSETLLKKLGHRSIF